jgi:hypothetical protein
LCAGDATNLNRPLFERTEIKHAFEQGCFSGPILACQSKQLARQYVESDVSKDPDVAKALADVLETDDGRQVHLALV